MYFQLCVNDRFSASPHFLKYSPETFDRRCTRECALARFNFAHPRLPVTDRSLFYRDPIFFQGNSCPIGPRKFEACDYPASRRDVFFFLRGVTIGHRNLSLTIASPPGRMFPLSSYFKPHPPPPPPPSRCYHVLAVLFRKFQLLCRYFTNHIHMYYIRDNQFLRISFVHRSKGREDHRSRPFRIGMDRANSEE